MCVPGLQVPVDVDVPDPEGAPDPNRGKVAGPDQPVHRHRGNPHELRDFLNRQKARFLTVQEVAQLMRVSSMTVYRLIRAGDLPAVRVGRSFRVRDVDVDGYLQSRYTQAG